MIVGTNARMGWLANIVVGIIGAFVGGIIYGVFTNRPWVAHFDVGTIIVSIIGAIVILLVYKAIVRTA